MNNDDVSSANSAEPAISADKVADAINLKLSGSALAGLILGIIALLLSAVPIINNFAALLAVAGLIFGIIGIVGTKKSKRRGRGMAITATILSVIALIVVVASQAMYSAVLDSVGDTIDTATGESTDELLETDVDVTFGQFSASTDEFGFSTTALPVTIKNKNADKKSYSVQVEAVNADGSRIEEETVYVDDLGSGQSQQVKVFEYIDSANIDAMKTATFKVVTVSQY